MKILAVIPARGGSKGIPRKNVRLMNGQPLILYAIKTALACPLISDVVVSSDDDEILSIAEASQAIALRRTPELSSDLITLDPVVFDAVGQIEKAKSITYDIVITLQPTSPLLSPETLQSALTAFIADDKDSYIAAVNRAHLTWSKTDQGYTPNYIRRVNRQQLPPLYFETGAFFISRRDCVLVDGRLGQKAGIFEVPEHEAVDIDSVNDWIVCENALRRKRIVLRADGYKTLGMGHIYHCLTLAYNLTGHDVMFVSRRQHKEGVEKIKASFMPLTLIDSDEDFFNFLRQWKADIVVNDCLDTSEAYVRMLKTLVRRVVTIEDLGAGTRHADAVINALYQEETPAPKHFCGEKYTCLRDEFLTKKPRQFSDEVKNVLVVFGGTDPCGLTVKVYETVLLIKEKYPQMTFTFILGSGYDLSGDRLKPAETDRIRVLADVRRISDYMQAADLAFTSQGRTVFELAALGVPSIVMAQNEREQLHTFAQMQNGFVNLDRKSVV